MSRRSSSKRKLSRSSEGRSKRKSSSLKSLVAPVSWSWDERRNLLVRILRLAPCDLPGVLVRIYDASVEQCAQVEKYDEGEVYMKICIQLDGLRAEKLQTVKEYVDQCFQYSFQVKEECEICEGMWSTAPVIPCGNDLCCTRIHEDCYGMIIRPDPLGAWFCPECELSKELKCVICLQTGGALKPTTDNRWIHVICCLAVPEIHMRDTPTMEPVEGLNTIHKSKFRKYCNLCNKKGGICIKCDGLGEDCSVFFHPRCAAAAGFLLGKKEKPLAVYCEKHLPPDRIPLAKRWIEEDDLVASATKTLALGIAAPGTEDAASYDYLRDSYVVQHQVEHCSKQFITTLRSETGTEYPEKDAEDSEDVTVSTSGVNSLVEVTAAQVANARFHFRRLRPLLAPPTGPATFTLHRPANAQPALPQVQDTEEHRRGASLLSHLKDFLLAAPVRRISSPTETPGESKCADQLSTQSGPSCTDMVGAIVEVYWGSLADWVGGEVLEWSSRHRAHQVRYFRDGYMEWHRMTAANTRVLKMPTEWKTGSNIRIRLRRVTLDGNVTYRPSSRPLVDDTMIVTYATEVKAPQSTTTSNVNGNLAHNVSV